MQGYLFSAIHPRQILCSCCTISFSHTSLPTLGPRETTTILKKRYKRFEAAWSFLPPLDQYGTKVLVSSFPVISSILPHFNVIYNSKHKRLVINWLVSQSILCSIVSHLPWIIPYISPSDFNMSFVHFTTYDWCDGFGSFCSSLLGKKEDEALLCRIYSPDKWPQRGKGLALWL